MSIQQTLSQCLPLASLQTTAEIDAEIREELEFHLQMRTQDNVGAGMSAEEAQRDAHQRFGDFEANRRACRKITLGPRLMLRRLQTGLLMVLLVTVIYQAVLLFNLQTSSRDRIESLTQLVEQLQVGRESVTNESTAIPYVRWNNILSCDISTMDGITAMDDGPNAEDLNSWSTAGDPLRQPWSDWGLLDNQAAY